MEQGRIRAAVDDDLSAIAGLHTKIYPTGAGGSQERRLAYLNNILFQHPWRDERLPSLVYEDTDGKIVGFLGVMPRPMLLHRERVHMTISHNYIVDPESRSSLASISLAKAFFSGPQTLSVCQPGDETARKLWRACGAVAARLYSFTWIWPLRPLTYVVERLQHRDVPTTLLRFATPLCRLIDKGVRRVGYRSFCAPAQRYIREALTAEALLECIREFSANRTLRPDYDKHTFPWVFDVLQRKQRYGTLEAQGIREKGGQLVGYYLYYAKLDGVSPVLQVGSRPGHMGDVLNELALDAWERGACALSGWLDPQYTDEISRRVLYFRYDHQAPLQIQSGESAVEAAIAAGRAFLTPLEGEWSLWFHDERGLHDHVTQVG